VQRQQALQVQEQMRIHAGHAHSRGGDDPIEGKYRQTDGTERHQTDFHLAARQSLAQQRPEADPDREHHDGGRDQRLVAVQHVVAVQRELHQHQGAIEPKPRHAEHRQQHGTRFSGSAQVIQGRGPRIPVQALARRYGVGLRDGQTGQEAEHGDEHQGRRDPRGVAVARQQTGGKRSQQNGEKRPGFQQRVAANQLAGIEHLRQQPVLGRREERGMYAHHEQRKQQQRDPLLRKADRRREHDDDFQSFDALENARLVEALAQLSCEP